MWYCKRIKCYRTRNQIYMHMYINIDAIKRGLPSMMPRSLPHHRSTRIIISWTVKCENWPIKEGRYFFFFHCNYHCIFCLLLLFVCYGIKLKNFVDENAWRYNLVLWLDNKDKVYGEQKAGLDEAKKPDCIVIWLCCIWRFWTKDITCSVG